MEATKIGESFKYTVVEFPDEVEENGVVPMALISSKWLIDEKGKKFCLWPTYFKTDAQRLKAVERHSSVQTENCEKNVVNIKYSSAQYQKAVDKLKKLEKYESVTETEVDEIVTAKRIRKRAILSNSFTDEYSSEEDIPTPPKPQKRPCSEILNTSSTNTTPKPQNKRLCSEIHVNTPSTSTITAPVECKGCSKNRDLMLTILRKLERLKEDVNIIIANTTPKSLPESLREIDLIYTVEDLENLNKKLDLKETEALVLLLQNVGGRDTIDTTKRILSRFIANDLATKYNWTGQHGKNAFSELKNIKKVIAVAVRKNHVCQNATDLEIDRAIKIWLRNAPDREGGRMARKKNV